MIKITGIKPCPGPLLLGDNNVKCGLSVGTCIGPAYACLSKITTPREKMTTSVYEMTTSVYDSVSTTFGVKMSTLLSF